MRASGGSVSEETRRQLAVKAFATRRADAMIHACATAPTAGGGSFGSLHPGEYARADTALRREPAPAGASTAMPESRARASAAVQRVAELSFKSILDTNAALELVKGSRLPPVPSSSTTTRVGVRARGISLLPSRVPLPATRSPAFGGDRRVQPESWMLPPQAMTGDGTFFEVILAPGFTEDALPILTEKKRWGRDLRLLEVPGWDGTPVSAPSIRI